MDANQPFDISPMSLASLRETLEHKVVEVKAAGQACGGKPVGFCHGFTGTETFAVKSRPAHEGSERTGYSKVSAGIWSRMMPRLGCFSPMDFSLTF
jgi:hypothetical protein